jgi:hypothetical protein
MKTIRNLLFLSFLFTLNSCCLRAKEEYLGNNIYLSEYDNIDRRIFYQKESCVYVGVEIIPMTVMEISHNSEWIIAKSGNKRKNSDFKYWVIKNNYDSIPNSKTIFKNRIEFAELKLFNSYLVEKKIDLELEKID